jgi:hypothetical protein
MRTSLRIALLLVAAGTAQLAANTGSGTLTLVTGQSGINQLNITVSANASGVTATDSETTTVSGSITSSFDANPTTGATTAMTITGGNIAMTNMHFVLKAFFGLVTVADISTANMGGTAYTPPPVPAPATPTASGGTFDASLHRVVINRGTMTGAITYTDPDTPINEDFATAPVEGAGTGTGTITMAPGTADATHRTIQATVQIPVDFTDTQDMNGILVSIRVQGTIKAAGPVRIPLDVLPTPTISPAGGMVPAGQPITITGESGSTIYYRVNGGAEQSAASPVTGLTVPAYPATLSISAYAKKSGWANSLTAQANYTTPAPASTPVFTPPSGEYPAGQPITITSESGATIFYTVNGGAEQSAPSPVTGLVVPAYPATLSISAYARKSGKPDSAVAQANYTSPPPYETWANTHFPGVTDPAIIGPDADPDRDGQVNSVEFVLGGHPDNAAVNAIIHSRVADSNDPDIAEELLLTIAVRTGTPAFTGTPSPSAVSDGFTCTVQGSADLADFSTLVLVVAPETTGLPAPPAGYEYRSFSLDQATGGGFLRVQVTAAQ